MDNLGSTYLRLPTRVLFIWFLLGISVFLLSIIWYILFSPWGVIPIVRSVSRNVTYSLSTNSSAYDSIDTLFVNIGNWMLVIGFLGVALFCYSYSQRRGYPV